MMTNKDFAVFILSHGRADNLATYHSILKAGYTGKIYILIDNEDKTADRYFELYGDQVIVFDKKAIADKIDTMDNFEGRKAIVYARNANFEIAKSLGIKYFLQLDDDYREWNYKFDLDMEYKSHNRIHELDGVFDVILNYFKDSPIKAIAMAQNGDFIGGKNGTMCNKGQFIYKRKCMNTWFFRTDDPVEFVGKLNEDFTASVLYGSLGELFITIPLLSIEQVPTQKGKGGMTDIYMNNGTFVKTFYTIMQRPSCVQVSMMGAYNPRMHHRTNWDNAVPKIINEKYKGK